MILRVYLPTTDGLCAPGLIGIVPALESEHLCIKFIWKSLSPRHEFLGNVFAKNFRERGPRTVILKACSLIYDARQCQYARSPSSELRPSSPVHRDAVLDALAGVIPRLNHKCQPAEKPHNHILLCRLFGAPNFIGRFRRPTANSLALAELGSIRPMNSANLCGTAAARHSQSVLHTRQRYYPDFSGQNIAWYFRGTDDERAFF